MTLYADVLFFVNFSMDFISLYFTAGILHLPKRPVRMASASAFGGLYGVFSVLWGLSGAVPVLLTVLSSCLICLIAFGAEQKRRYLISVSLFWGVGFLLGGIMSGLGTLLSRVVPEHTEAGKHGGIRFLALGVISAAVALLLGRIFEEKKTRVSVPVTVTYGGRSATFEALCDSGNLLREPLSGSAVILLSERSQAAFVFADVPEGKKRYIPYHIIGSDGLLIGVRPDSVAIGEDGKAVDAVIALTKEKTYGGFAGCVPASLV